MLGYIAMAGAAGSAAQLGRGIRKLRKQKGWTQDRLAEKANINRASLNALELGKSNPSFILVESIASVLKTTVTGLMAAGRVSLKSSDEELKKIFAQNVKERRLLLGYSRKELAEPVGLIAQYISTTENARRLPTLKNAIRLAKALGVPVSSLIVPGGTTLDTVRRPDRYNEISDIQERMRSIRLERALTLDALSRMSGIGQHHIAQIELGSVNPTLPTIIVFCSSLGISYSSVLDA